MSEAVLWAIILSPLAAFTIITLYLRKIPQIAGYLSIVAIAISFLLALITLVDVLGAHGHVAIHSHEWFQVGPLELTLGVRIDGLTAVMLVVVSSVSLLVQVYSQGYMAGDPGYGRYYAYMSLFITAMLGLVLADNLFMLFVFWELVGLSSYLLIGFWFHKPSAAAAAKKAFIVTRIGDLGLLAAILLVWTRTETLAIHEIHHLALTGAFAGTTVTLFGLGLFAGAVGKSAQFPLHVWLPDAMEGPTPVSALIHAATMVAAGVYLMARFWPVLEVAPDAREVVGWIGAATVVVGASLALVQTDLKRVLAYSTISQLGYMMLALGVFGYAVAVFHLFTHAFFKALLFLGSGSVNHATNTFDMRRMGGLRKVMPITFGTFLIGTLSLAGVFPLAGFWSKDEILLEAWVNNRGLYTVAAIASFMTALYMFRAVFMTFFGEYKGGEPVDREDEDSHFHGDPAHPHESSWVMTVPLLILTAGAIAAGWWAWGKEFHHFVEAAVPAEALHKAPEFSYGIAITSSIIALAGIATAWAIYHKRLVSSEEIRKTALPIALLLEHKFFLDDLYERVFTIRVFQRGWNRLVERFDMLAVDGAVNGIGWVGTQSSRVVRHAQTGQLQLYGVGIAAGVFIVAIIVFIASPL
ncbi:MAG: NADH-quinone oxidoreductase subunit L [Dehalococcoidia bacterium]|nr:NADH-quinone oxidoreductase subunit L [Dehalococcoidia bacterium]